MTSPFEPWRFGCCRCNAVHESPSFMIFPDSIRVLRDERRDKNGDLLKVELTYECTTHAETAIPTT